MRYKLIHGAERGVTTNRTPVLRDIRGTFEVPFDLPSNNGFVALLLGTEGREYKVLIKDGVLKIPKSLIGKEQYVALTVSEVDGDHIVQTWECEPLVISAFIYMRQTQWQISGGMTDKDCCKRLAELEERYAQVLTDFDALKAQYAAQAAQIDEHELHIAALQTSLGEALNDVQNIKNGIKNPDVI